MKQIYFEQGVAYKTIEVSNGLYMKLDVVQLCKFRGQLVFYTISLGLLHYLRIVCLFTFSFETATKASERLGFCMLKMDSW